MTIYDQLESELVVVAASLIGTVEEGWNTGPMIEEFQKAIDGKAQGEPYCQGFVHWCIFEAEKRISAQSREFAMSDLYRSESTMKVWTKSHQALEIVHPRVGCLMYWQQYKNGQPTWMGHVGIVAAILDENTVATIEGNTGSGDQREGEGVFQKTRHIRHDLGSLRPKGFLAPWG